MVIYVGSMKHIKAFMLLMVFISTATIVEAANYPVTVKAVYSDGSPASRATVAVCNTNCACNPPSEKTSCWAGSTNSKGISNISLPMGKNTIFVYTKNSNGAIIKIGSKVCMVQGGSNTVTITLR
jgi:hypothetical protein